MEAAEPEITEEDKVAVTHSLRDFHTRQLMALALIRSGMDAVTVRRQSGVTAQQYKSLLKKYHDDNFDKLTTSVIENWGNIVLAKMMNVTERSVDSIMVSLENGDMKDAKDASQVFATLFDKFRLSTGKSTENIASTTQRITQMIESKTSIQKPNQSSYHETATVVDTSAPDLSEVM